MGVTETINYLLYENPISQSILSTSKSAFGYVIPKKPIVPEIPAITVITERTPLWELAAQQGPFVRIAGLCGASAVILGAYGAHKSYPKDRVKELKPIYETANKFHFIHSLALLGVPLCKNPRLSGSLIIAGTVLFSGACYYHAFTGDNKFGRLAPVGGTMLIVGWLAMVL